MSLPLTNLTLHCDGSTNTDVWKNYQAGTPYHNTNSFDGDVVQVWDDTEHGGYCMYGGASPAIVYKSVTPLMQNACLAFNGTTSNGELMDDPGASGFPAGSTFFGAGAKTAIFALYVAGIATNATTNTYNNDAILADTGLYYALYLRDAGSGVYKIGAYNWDGNEDIVELTISLNTSYVVTWRHDGTNSYLSLNGGAESSVASGNTQVVTFPIRFGTNGAAAHFFNGRIGEFALWNAALTGSNLSDANAYFTAKWLAAAAMRTQPLIASQAVNRSYTY